MTDCPNKTLYLLLWLQGPFQSWGDDSKFNRRTTNEFPTRSGIMGMILSALGASGEQRELLARFAPLTQTVISYVREDKNGSPSRPEMQLQDFHMVGAGYNQKDSWEKLLIPRKADGALATGGGVKLTYRHYLQDATFAAIVEIPADMKDNLESVMKAPCFDLSLGRKNCVPTEFIYQGIYQTQDEAIAQADKLAAELDPANKRVESFRVIDDASDAGETIRLNDVPIQFGMRKVYADRIVTKILK